MNISGDVIVLRSKEVTTVSQARVTFGRKGRDMTKEIPGCWQGPFLGLANDYKGVHFVKIHQALRSLFGVLFCVTFCNINS